MGYLLTSAHFGLRPWTENDLPLALTLWGDPAVTRYLGGPFHATAVHNRLATEIAQFQQTGLQYWPVFCRTDHAHIGCAGLRPYPAAPRTFEFGIHLLPASPPSGAKASPPRLPPSSSPTPSTPSAHRPSSPGTTPRTTPPAACSPN